MRALKIVFWPVLEIVPVRWAWSTLIDFITIATALSIFFITLMLFSILLVQLRVDGWPLLLLVPALPLGYATWKVFDRTDRYVRQRWPWVVRELDWPGKLRPMSRLAVFLTGLGVLLSPYWFTENGYGSPDSEIEPRIFLIWLAVGLALRFAFRLVGTLGHWYMRKER